ncbi:alpha/beta hydrolase [Serinibacter arcticus]|uniref:Alpha/beta hydrolase n=1 Tax=Serinibacter arcticus TaxID=1655435 RepID=A0A2U1ZYG2_9MICO|nr:alpha/beta hydrolase [Serinibacter arcticus]PWD52004.1 alpha/beta hydrolase [Serinibacter arcticus]
MPRLDKAKLAPNGLNVRIQRMRVAGEYLRVWRMSVDDVEPDAVRPGPRHTFVLVHGLGVSSYYFEPLAARLARAGVVYLLDLPGFDGVPHAGQALGIGGFADVVAAWCEREGVQDPVLVGHSMGAQVVVETLARHPELATRSVLIGPPVNASERSPGWQVLRLAQSSLHESFGTRQQAIAGYLRCGPHWMMRVLPALLDYRIEDRIAAVRARLLVLRGSWDGIAPQGWIEELTAAAARASHAEIEGASHAVVYEHFAETAALVLAHADGDELDGTHLDGHHPAASPDGLAVGTEEEAAAVDAEVDAEIAAQLGDQVGLAVPSSDSQPGDSEPGGGGEDVER